MAQVDEYKGERITVLNDGKRCIHSRYCVLNLPNVFKPNVDGPWIDPGAAATEATIAVITNVRPARCVIVPKARRRLKARRASTRFVSQRTVR